ncbi:MAG: hypothetical protein M1824_001141 [Vezdaea acicularis]|nr:MAG: hypothetical protein M1824_001141 [Vezdaea acicularis]
MASDEYEVYKLGDFKLQSRKVLPDAHIAYTTFGESKLPAIIYPTWFSGALSDNFWLIGPDKALNPEKYYIIVPALFGNGQSSSPSNTSLDQPFPACTLYDNVRAQYELVTKKLNVYHARVILGWSMGAQQTYQWATQYPDFMDCIVPFCGSARTSLHNQVFLEGVKSALLAARGERSAGSGDGWVPIGRVGAEKARTWTEDAKQVGLKAFGRAYAGWGFSQTFYRKKLYESYLGYKSLEDFMANFWEAWACSKDPENLLVMLQTWQNGDCSKQPPYNGNFEKAMRGIKAKALVLPGQTDLYFPPEDSEYEVENMTEGVGKVEPIPSIWGHWAGGPGLCKEDVKFIDEKIKGFLYEAVEQYLEGAAKRALVTGEKSNFQFILRLLNTNVEGKQKVMYALTKIKGVGRRYSNLVCKKADVDLNKRAGELTSEELERIVTIIQNPTQYKIPSWFLNRQRDIVDGKDSQVLANNVDSKLRDDLERLKKIRAHRGLRHYWGLRVRGQHSKTTGRRGRTVGVSKKKG